jgi:hypothetical protein
LEFDAKVDDGLARICGWNGELPPVAKKLRGLPQCKGGISIRRMSETRSAAFATSFMRAYQRIHPYIWNLIEPLQDLLLPYSLLLTTTVPLFQSLGASGNIIWHEQEGGEEAEDRPIPSQKSLCDRVENEEFQAVLAALEHKPKLMAWLRSSRTHGTVTWLTSGTATSAVSLDPKDFIVALRLRLLLPALNPSPTTFYKCRQCEEILSLEDVSFHSLECGSVKGLRNLRHNMIEKALHDFLKTIHPRAELSMESTVPSEVPDRIDKRADVLVRIDQSTFIIDLVVTTPSCHTNMEHGSVNEAISAGISAATKRREWTAVIPSKVESCFIPFALESTGRFGADAQAFIAKVCGISRTLFEASDRWKRARKFFQKRVSTIIHRYNAHMIRQISSSVVSCSPVANIAQPISALSRTLRARLNSRFNTRPDPDPTRELICDYTLCSAVVSRRQACVQCGLHFCHDHRLPVDHNCGDAFVEDNGIDTLC